MKNMKLLDDWKKVKISDLGKILTGNTPSTKCEEYYSSNDVMFIRPDDLRQNTLNKINTSKVYISSIGAQKARKVSAGSILVTCIGIIGKVAIVEDEACFNQQINAIIPDNNIVDAKFLGYSILKYNYVLKAVANAPIVPIINKTQFSDIELNIPSLETQKKIVEILDKAEKALEKRKEAIKLLDELVKSRFIGMFGDFSKNNKGWEEVELSNVCSVIHRYPTFYGMDYIEEGTPVIRIGNILSDGILEDEMENYVLVYDDVNKDFPLTKIELGDILMAVRGDGSAAKRIGIVTTEKLIGEQILVQTC